MIINADLHIHSHFSNSTNKKMNIKTISLESPRKGIDVVATGDCLHNGWINEIKNCNIVDEGTYELNGTYFICSTEIVDKNNVHHLLYFPSISVVEEFKEKIKNNSSNIDKDGKPSLNIRGDEIASLAKDLDVIIGPAHIFTPWTSVYAIHDSLKECYGDLSDYVSFAELGLSANTDHADKIQELHRLTFLTNSDSHNPHPVRFAREFNKFDVKDKSFKEIKKAILRNGNNKVVLNVGLPPQEGKYYESACASCYKHYTLKEAQQRKWKCNCGKNIKKGVKDRIYEIATFPEPQHPYHRPPYLYLIPLSEIITKAIRQPNPFTEISFNRWNELISVFGNEIDILFDVNINDIAKITVPAITEAIQSFRDGDLIIKPGGGGKYGIIEFPQEKNSIMISLNPKQR
jgi:uncharacterized protein (TIGR00375 family)